MMGLVSLEERPESSLASSSMCGYSKKTKQKDIKSSGVTILQFWTPQPPKTVRNKYLLLINHPVYAFFYASSPKTAVNLPQTVQMFS